MVVVVLEEVREGLFLIERDDGQQGVAGEGEVERGVGASVPVIVLGPE